MGVEKKQTEDDTQNAAREVSRRDFISISLVICVIILYYVEELVAGSEHTLKGPWVFLWAERTFAGFFTFCACLDPILAKIKKIGRNIMVAAPPNFKRSPKNFGPKN